MQKLAGVFHSTLILHGLKYLAHFQGITVLLQANESTGFTCVAWKLGGIADNEVPLKNKTFECDSNGAY